ncbi:MAG: D-glycero-beta-D-manno-heptose 1-phosphate adenylyltransferase [Arenicella sp.]
MATDKKIISSSNATAFNKKIAMLARPLVFTNGCFDILHRGHTSYLESARNVGAALIVGVNSDASVRRQNKGSDRPINKLEDRMALLAALHCVDAVIAFDQDTPIKLIETIKPDHLVKGGDWPIESIVGADFVHQHGGKVHSIPFEFDRSTTQLLGKIRHTLP